ncbi:MAG: hypothetical protein JWR72_1176 [Flavisolibacter sp.]|nr:hypothetical protein [Flavisolibacter sp.]MDB5248337.1 hypothetical protein [Segetibacter sp.]
MQRWLVLFDKKPSNHPYQYFSPEAKGDSGFILHWVKRGAFLDGCECKTGFCSLSISLTRREREVLALLIEGQNSEQIVKNFS